MLGTLLALALAASPPSVPVREAARRAVEAALAVPQARVEVLDVAGAVPASCALVHAETPRPITGSGKAAVHLSGRDARGHPCAIWVWARVRVTGLTLVTTRAVADGEPLTGAVSPVEREIVPGRPLLAALPEGAVAGRPLPPGTALDEALLRIGARPGEPVAVVLRAGAIVVEQAGRAAACQRGRACAVLPSGARVEGTWHAGRIELEAP